MENTNPEAMCVWLSPFVCSKSRFADMCRLWMCTLMFFLFRIKWQKQHVIRLGLGVRTLRLPAQILWVGFTDRRMSWLLDGVTWAGNEAGEDGGHDLNLMSGTLMLSVALSSLHWWSVLLLSLHVGTEVLICKVEWLDNVLETDVELHCACTFMANPHLCICSVK